MILKLYGTHISTCTQRVAVVLREKDVPYEIVTVNFSKSEHKSEEYLRRHPFGQMPYIVDDNDFVLFESRAIARYVAAKYRDQGTTLLPEPADLKANAVFEQAMCIEVGTFEPYAIAILVEKFYKPSWGAAGDEEVVKNNLTTLAVKLQGYEAILSKQQYLAGNEVTLADVLHLPSGHLLGQVGYDILVSGKYPNVTRWWNSICSRPSWQAVMA